jgi:hypothetical protein
MSIFDHQNSDSKSAFVRQNEEEMGFNFEAGQARSNVALSTSTTLPLNAATSRLVGLMSFDQYAFVLWI